MEERTDLIIMSEALGAEFLTSGVTEKTPENILMDAGTIHKGLKFSGGKWNFKESLYGATSGGTKLSIVPNLDTAEIDGVHVNVVGLTQKYGETATIETNIAEITPDVLKDAVFLSDGTTENTGYSVLESKNKIETGDYLKDFAYVGKTMSGKPIIVIFDYALCTSGFEVQSTSGKQATYTAKFECYAPAGGSTDKLPYHIFYPTEAQPASVAETQSAKKTTAVKA